MTDGLQGKVESREQYSVLRRIRNEKATTTGSIIFGSS